MRGPTCPNCKAKLLLRGTRQNRQTLDIEAKKWYQFAGYRKYCPKCGVRLRSQGGAYVWTACFLLVIANAFGAHRAVFETWGYAGLAAYYLGWAVLSLALAARVKYVRFPEHDS